MQTQKLDAQIAAQHYANRVAPLPGCDSIGGTVLAVFASNVAAAIFTIVAGVFFDLSVQLPSCIAVAVVGMGSYRLLNRAEQRHYRARAWMGEFLRVNHAPDDSASRRAGSVT